MKIYADRYPMKLAVVILNWNDFPTTKECLERLANWSTLKPLVIVVDNASQDDSAKRIEREVPTVSLIHSDRNRGFAGGNNLGITLAREKGAKLILLLNSDARVSEEAVIALIKQLEKEKTPAIIGPMIEEQSNGKSVLTAGGRDIGIYSRTRITAPPSTTRKEHTALSDKPSDAPDLLAVDYVPGTVLLSKMAVFDKVGLLDEDYFFSGEIADFCARAKTLGIPSLIDTRVTAHHGDTQSPKPLRNTLYIYYTLRNRFLYIHKHGKKLRHLLQAIWFLKGCAMLTLALAKMDTKKARAIRLALIDGIRGQFGCRNELFEI